MSHRAFWNLAPLALTVLLAAGCGGALIAREDQLVPEAKYGELKTYMEGKLAGTPSPSTAQLNYLCTSYAGVKEYAKLFACLDRMQARIDQGDRTFSVFFDASAQPATMRAQALLELGNYAEAVRQAEAAWKIVTEKKLAPYARIQVLSALSLAYALNRDRDSALKSARLLEAEDTSSWTTQLLTTDKLNGLAKTYMALGDFTSSLAFIQKDTTDFMRGFTSAMVNTFVMQPGYDIFAYSQLPHAYMLNKSLLETGQAAQAKNGYDALLKVPQVQENGEIYWMALQDRARIAESEKDSTGAILLYQRAIEVIERQRSSIDTEASKIGFVGDKQAVYGRLVVLLVSSGRATEAFQYVERSKSRALVDMLASKKSFTVAGADSQKAQALLAQLDSADLASRVQDETARGEAASSVRTLQVARTGLEQAAPELSSLVSVSSVPDSELRVLVGADEALVEYYMQEVDGKTAGFAFLLERAQLRVVAMDFTGLEAQVRDFRNALQRPDSAAWQAPSRALYTQLWAPLEPLVAGKRLVIVPHGALHYVPFAALQDSGGRFLMDDHALRFLPSASVLKYLKPYTGPRTAGLLALGNPDLGDAALALQFAEDEAREVAGLYPSSRLLVRKDATETNFRNVAAAFSRIHLATHGKFQADDPLASGIYLAKDGLNDGLLSVGELYSMSLDNDLVTLSACETGLGKVANGDDVVGLTRGFLYAGSRSIVASLWSVDDRATAELMRAFYGNLKQGDKEAALRQAQAATRKAFPHPYYWAAFQLTGRAD